MVDRLTIGVAQLATEATLERNARKITAMIPEAKAKGCRLLITPEGALYSEGTTIAQSDAAVDQIRQAARDHDIYVLLGLHTRLKDGERMHNRLLAIGPAGDIAQSYDKLWCDKRFPHVPGPFLVDDVPCCGIICADRWHRSVEELPVWAGVKLIIECSNNYNNEWIPAWGWYWYVPRAIRNNAYVVLCNSSYDRPGPGRESGPGHGHCAVIAPDGELLVTAAEEPDRLLVASLDLARATRDEAVKRHSHPLFKPFWDVGGKLMGGAKMEAPSFKPLAVPEVQLTVAAAQMACSRDIGENLTSFRRLVAEAKTGGADVVAFPELAVTGPLQEDIRAATEARLEGALAEVQSIARDAGLTVAFGMPGRGSGETLCNSAFVVGPDGSLLTRYDQMVVDRADLFAAGMSSKAMWFEVKGVPAVVTLGQDALWSEIAELAATRGASLHLHLAHDLDDSPKGRLLRKQLWVNLASYRTLTVTVNAASPASGGSAIWQDFYRGSAGKAGGYIPHSAVALAEAGNGEQLLLATDKILPFNSQYDRMTQRSNPQMAPWYIAGAQAIYDSREGWDTGG